MMTIKIYYLSGITKKYSHCTIEIQRPMRKSIKSKKGDLLLYDLPYLELVVSCRRRTHFINLDLVRSVEVLIDYEK